MSLLALWAPDPGPARRRFSLRAWPRFREPLRKDGQILVAADTATSPARSALQAQAPGGRISRLPRRRAARCPGGLRPRRATWRWSCRQSAGHIRKPDTWARVPSRSTLPGSRSRPRGSRRECSRVCSPLPAPTRAPEAQAPHMLIGLGHRGPALRVAEVRAVASLPDGDPGQFAFGVDVLDPGHVDACEEKRGPPRGGRASDLRAHEGGSMRAQGKTTTAVSRPFGAVSRSALMVRSKIFCPSAAPRRSYCPGLNRNDSLPGEKKSVIHFGFNFGRRVLRFPALL